jgi:hypothetical protein
VVRVFQPWNAYMADINGDGAAEFLFWDTTAGYTSQRMLAFVGTDGGVKTSLLRSGRAPGSVRYQFVDVNGDGLPDAIEIPINGVAKDGSKDFRVVINSGRDFLKPTHISVSPFSGSPTQMGQSLTAIYEGDYSILPDNVAVRDPGLRSIDFDLDGREDLIQLGNACGAVSNSTGYYDRGAVTVLQAAGGSSLFSYSTLAQTDDGNAIPIGDEAYHWPAGTGVCGGGFSNSQIADVNGDGLADIVQPENGEIVVYTRVGMAPGLLTDVVDGLGEKTHVEYLPMTDPRVHTAVPHGECTYPQDCRVRGQWLVSSHTVGYTSPKPLKFEHSYSGSRRDVSGVGWLGMDSHTVRDTVSETVVIAEYDHTSNLGGALYTGLAEPSVKTEGYPVEIVEGGGDEVRYEEDRTRSRLSYRTTRTAGRTRIICRYTD